MSCFNFIFMYKDIIMVFSSRVSEVKDTYEFSEIQSLKDEGKGKVNLCILGDGVIF